jgi:hypothetical protein
MENILHYPQLDSILMVEKIIQEMKNIPREWSYGMLFQKKCNIKPLN